MADAARPFYVDPTPPAGYCWSWVPTAQVDPRWQLLDADGPEQRCRWGAGPGHTACGQPSVARMNRASSRRRPAWWHYCERHLYGQRIVDGQLQRRALVEATR